MRFRRLQQEGAARIAELTEDPELADITRTLAASQFVVEQHAPVMPSEAEVRAWAMRMYSTDAPSAGQVEAARTELGVIAIKMFERHVRIQQRASRQQVEADMLMQVAMPVMRQFAEDLMAIIDDEIDAAAAARIRERFGAASAVAVGRLAEAD